MGNCNTLTFDIFAIVLTLIIMPKNQFFTPQGAQNYESENFDSNPVFFLDVKILIRSISFRVRQKKNPSAVSGLNQKKTNEPFPSHSYGNFFGCLDIRTGIPKGFMSCENRINM